MIFLENGKVIGDKHVFIIAEIGKNFIVTETGESATIYLDRAKALIKAAKEAGADAVKFQTHNFVDEQYPVDVFSPHFNGADRYNWIKRNTEATPLEFWKALKQYAYELGIIFFSTPMSRGAAVLLNEVGVPLWKIGSGDLLDFAMLDYIRNSLKPIIISTGMSTDLEVKKAVDFIKEKNNNLVVLHCVSKYPCPPEDLKLETIDYLRSTFDCLVGFSDHSLGTAEAAMAVMRGAKVIEKHFSFDRNAWGPDHKVSLTPVEFSELVAVIRNAEHQPQVPITSSLGKICQDDEAKFRPYFRKALVMANDLPAGTVITPEMVYAMRPAGFIAGLPSEKYPDILGKQLKKTLKKLEPITEDCV